MGQHAWALKGFLPPCPLRPCKLVRMGVDAGRGLHLHFIFFLYLLSFLFYQNEKLPLYCIGLTHRHNGAGPQCSLRFPETLGLTQALNPRVKGLLSAQI